MNRLNHLAARVADDPAFVAYALRRYADADLPMILRCDAATITRLKLCRMPRSTHFDADVAEIAHRFGLHAGRLGRVLREGEAR
jgi:hypothetical protein